MSKPKTIRIGDTTYWSSGHDIGECDTPHCGERAFSCNEDGDKYCEDCLENWHLDKDFEDSSDDDLNEPDDCEYCGEWNRCTCFD